MANPHRGEVGFTALGKNWTLKYGANALATLEKRFDTKLSRLGEILADVSVGEMIIFMAAGLQKYHPGVTDEQAGDIMDDVGLQQAGGLIGEAITLSVSPGEAKAETSGQ